MNLLRIRATYYLIPFSLWIVTENIQQLLLSSVVIGPHFSCGNWKEWESTIPDSFSAALNCMDQFSIDHSMTLDLNSKPLNGFNNTDQLSRIVSRN